MLEDTLDNSTADTGWGRVASFDGAPAVIDTLLHLDPEETYTKTELSDAAGVPLKTLYLDGTLDALVEMELLQKHEADGEEVRFGVDTDSETFRAAAAFDEAVSARVPAGE